MTHPDCSPAETYALRAERGILLARIEELEADVERLRCQLGVPGPSPPEGYFDV